MEIRKNKWGFIRETTKDAIIAGLDKDTGLCRTGLEVYLSVIFPNRIWIHNKGCGVKNANGNIIRPDYRCEELKLIVEFDGLGHYKDELKIKTDKLNTKQYEAAGYKVVRIPYFIQLTNKAIKTLFGIDVKEPMFDETIPSMGPKGKNTPSVLCELGIKRMAQEFHIFPEQYEVNVKALKSTKHPQRTGVELLEKAFDEII